MQGAEGEEPGSSSQLGPQADVRWQDKGYLYLRAGGSCTVLHPRPSSLETNIKNIWDEEGNVRMV